MATWNSDVWGWERYFEEVSVVITSLGGERRLFANLAYTEHVLEKLEHIMSTLSTLIDHVQSTASSVTSEEETTVVSYYESQLLELLECLQHIALEWQVHMDQVQREGGAIMCTPNVAFQVTTVDSQGSGRPKFNITKEQLEYLSSLSFSWSQIAQLLHVSRMTVYRRRVEFGLLSDPTRHITDSDLVSTVRRMRTDFPEIGETIAWGQLRSKGIQVTRERIRTALRQTDPLNTALRWRGNLTRRRPYSVPGPNSLWHLGEFLLGYGLGHDVHYLLLRLY
jgi:hypothetical protein